MSDNRNTSETLPCGCRMSTVDEVFVFEPHADDCVWYQYVLEMAKQNDKPITTLEI